MVKKKTIPSTDPLVIDHLVKTFPNCFDPENPKPLKIGIGKELIAMIGTPILADFNKKQLRAALSRYVRSKSYDAALAAGGMRYGLDGEPAGEITLEHQEYAKIPIKDRNKKEEFVIEDMAALLNEVITMAIPGRFAVTIKINQLPVVKPISPQSVVFAVKSGARTYLIELKTKQWKSLQDAANQYPMWMAAITGELGEALPMGNGFRIEKPAMQVFEKKAKGEKAEDDHATPTAEPVGIQKAAPLVPTPLPPPASGRPRLSLKS